MSTRSPVVEFVRKTVPSAPPATGSNVSPSKLVRPLLSDIMVEHGPVDLLGRLFLKADTSARKRGITLSFAPMQDLIDINRANPETWRPILPLFDPASGGITDDNSFCILGHNPEGEIVATQAARLYDWADTSFHEEASSLRLFYAEPERSKGEREQVEVTAPAASELTRRGDLCRRHLVPARLSRHRPALHSAVAVAHLCLHALEARLLAQHHGGRGLQARHGAAQRLQQGGLGSLAAAHAGRSARTRSAARSSTWIPASCSTAPPTS